MSDFAFQPVIILPVTPEDKAEVAALFKADAEAKKIWPGGISMNWYFFWNGQKENNHWVKAVGPNGNILGSVHWTVRKRDGGRTLHDIAVLPSARGQGLGKILVDHIGLPITLKTDHDSQANGFYLKLGFVLQGQAQSRSGLKMFNVYRKE